MINDLLKDMLYKKEEIVDENGNITRNIEQIIYVNKRTGTLVFGLETLRTEVSINKLAKQLGVSYKRLSSHLRGGKNNINGLHFIRTASKKDYL